MNKHLEELREQGSSDLPSILSGHDDAKAYFGVIHEHLPIANDIKPEAPLAADIALRTEEIINQHKIRDWVHKIDVLNAMVNDIEDYLFSIKGRYDLEFSIEELDKAMQLLMNVAKRREGYGQ